MGSSTVILAVICAALVLQTHAAYLSFARGGRSNTPSCCPMGIKTEWHRRNPGIGLTSVTCQQNIPCCDGLEEILKSKGNGALYTMCVRVDRCKENKE